MDTKTALPEPAVPRASSPVMDVLPPRPHAPPAAPAPARVPQAPAESAQPVPVPAHTPVAPPSDVPASPPAEHASMPTSTSAGSSAQFSADTAQPAAPLQPSRQKSTKPIGVIICALLVCLVLSIAAFMAYLKG